VGGDRPPLIPPTKWWRGAGKGPTLLRWVACGRGLFFGGSGHRLKQTGGGDPGEGPDRYERGPARTFRATQVGPPGRRVPGTAVKEGWGRGFDPLGGGRPPWGQKGRGGGETPGGGERNSGKQNKGGSVDSKSLACGCGGGGYPPFDERGDFKPPTPLSTGGRTGPRAKRVNWEFRVETSCARGGEFTSIEGKGSGPGAGERLTQRRRPFIFLSPGGPREGDGPGKGDVWAGPTGPRNVGLGGRGTMREPGVSGGVNRRKKWIKAGGGAGKKRPGFPGAGWRAWHSKSPRSRGPKRLGGAQAGNYGEGDGRENGGGINQGGRFG